MHWMLFVQTVLYECVVFCRELNEVRNTNSDLTMECTKLRGEVLAEKV